MHVCINPSCSNVDTFEGETCPVCHNDICATTGNYMRAISDYDSCIALIDTNRLALNADITLPLH